MSMFGRSKPTAPVEPEPVVIEPVRLPDPPLSDASGRRQVADQQRFLLGQVEALRPFAVGLLDALGLTLCETIVSDLALPMVTAATVDGWAVRAANLVGASQEHPVELAVIGAVESSYSRPAPLVPGATVRVSCGAPIPEGADAVVPLGQGEVLDSLTKFTAEIAHSANLAPAGARVAEGEQVAAAEAVLGARDIGRLAELGVDKVLARPRCRVAVLSVADDLVAPGVPLANLAQSYDATTALIAASAASEGATVFAVPPLPTGSTALSAVLADQLVRSDLIIVIGDPESIAPALAELGPIDEAALALDPVGRTAFALLGEERVPTLVLPGGTSVAYLGYQVFARPLLQRLAGRDVAPASSEEGLAVAVLGDPEAVRLVLVRRTTAGVAPISTEGAIELTVADGWVLLDAGVDLAVGDQVVVWSLER